MVHPFSLSVGIPVPENEARWSQALAALKGVWASKYNDRAYYSLRWGRRKFLVTPHSIGFCQRLSHPSLLTSSLNRTTTPQEGGPQL